MASVSDAATNTGNHKSSISFSVSPSNVLSFSVCESCTSFGQLYPEVFHIVDAIINGTIYSLLSPLLA